MEALRDCILSQKEINKYNVCGTKLLMLSLHFFFLIV